MKLYNAIAEAHIDNATKLGKMLGLKSKELSPKFSKGTFFMSSPLFKNVGKALSRLETASAKKSAEGDKIIERYEPKNFDKYIKLSLRHETLNEICGVIEKHVKRNS